VHGWGHGDRHHHHGGARRHHDVGHDKH
jgi:hypothetical protein